MKHSIFKHPGILGSVYKLKSAESVWMIIPEHASKASTILKFQFTLTMPGSCFNWTIVNLLLKILNVLLVEHFN